MLFLLFYHLAVMGIHGNMNYTVERQSWRGCGRRAKAPRSLPRGAFAATRYVAASTFATRVPASSPP
jgi:hypothetical protein